MQNIIGAIVVLGILITVHELGHAVAARLFGIRIEKFSIGFGPKLIGFMLGETEFRLSLIPLGGYLKMQGENLDEEVKDPERSFKTKKWWQRSLVAFAGPFFNLILALLVFIISFMIGKTYKDNLPVIGRINSTEFAVFQPGDRVISFNGEEIEGWNQLIQLTREEETNTVEIIRQEENMVIELPSLDKSIWYNQLLPYAPAVVGEVAPGLSAYRTGIVEGDSILAVNGKPVNDWYEMRELITSNQTERIQLKLKRDGRLIEKELDLEENLLEDNRIIGITQQLPVRIEERYSILESIRYGTVSTASFVVLNYVMLYKLLANPGSIKSNLGGPVMIFTMSQQTIKEGWDTILGFIAAISIILMIMNLLPIPILDGGHIMFCLIEGVFRKPLSQKVQVALQNIGFLILISLMIFAFFNDFNRIFNRKMSMQEETNKSTEFQNQDQP